MTNSVSQDRYLIVNGDDFGLSSQVNAGIVHAHQHGILTDASLMVTGLAWREAVELARANPQLSVGLHITLVQGKSVFPPHLLSAVTDFGGNFPNDPTLAGLRYFFSRRAREQVREECRAQIERFLATGLVLTHLDGHLSIHMHPVVCDIVIALMQEYGIPAMRVTQEDLSVSLAYDPRQRFRQYGESFIFSRLAQRATQKLRALRLVFPDTLFGLHLSGRVDEQYLLYLLPKLQVGVTELYCHPSFLPCPEVERWTPTYRRADELAALTSTNVRSTIDALGISLISYRELPVLGAGFASRLETSALSDKRAGAGKAMNLHPKIN
jgi:hopanoid biosynthesis associated protein HpnK